MTHKPTYGLVSGAPMNGGDFTEQYTFSGNASANSAFAGGKVPPQISLFLSGHIHQFEYVNFNNNTDFAPQLIVGVGGEPYYRADRQSGREHSLAYAFQQQAFTVHTTSNTSSTTSTTVGAAYSQAEFGFALLLASPGGYAASVYNIYSSRAKAFGARSPCFRATSRCRD